MRQGACYYLIVGQYAYASDVLCVYTLYALCIVVDQEDVQDLLQDRKTMMTHSEVIEGFGGFILKEPVLSLHYCLARAVSHRLNSILDKISHPVELCYRLCLFSLDLEKLASLVSVCFLAKSIQSVSFPVSC